MGFTWDPHRIYMGSMEAQHGTNMGFTWDPHGINMGQTWDQHGIFVGSM